MKKYKVLTIVLLLAFLCGCSPKITFNRKDINSSQAKQITDMSLELLNTHFEKSEVKLISVDIEGDRYGKYLLSLKADIESEDLNETLKDKNIWVLLREVDLEKGIFYYDENGYVVEKSIDLEKLRKSNYWMVDTQELANEYLLKVENSVKSKYYEEAIMNVEKVLKISPNDEKAIKLKAEIIIQQAKDKLKSTKDTSVYEKQIKKVEEIFEIIPNYNNAKEFILESNINLIQLYFDQKEFDSAISTANNTLRNYPENYELKKLISDSEKSKNLVINNTAMLEYLEGHVKISSRLNFIDDTIVTVRLNQKYDNEVLDTVEEHLVVKDENMEGIVKIPSRWGATELEIILLIEAGNAKVQQPEEFYNLYGNKLENIIQIRSSKNNSSPTIMHSVHYYKELKDGHCIYEIQNDYHRYPDHELVESANKIRFKNSCKVYSYAILQKDSDKMNDKPIKISGKIFDIWEEGRYTYILLTVGSNLNNVAITVNEHIPCYKGDNVTIWGRVRGFYSYISVAGHNITTPKISAEIWQQ